MVEKVSADKDTLVVVLADHETGNTTYEGGGSAGFKFRSLQHSAKNVPYFLFADVKIPKVIDNTDVYKICKDILNN